MNALKPWHILVLLVVILLLFGAKRLPDLAKSVGESLKIFKSEMKDLTDDDKGTKAGDGTATTAKAGDGTTTTSSEPPAGDSTAPRA
ncbi:Sec-independent protein translocase subunit TatA [Cellulomonas hominis]